MPSNNRTNPLQYSCLENPVDGGAWWAAVHRVAQSDTTEVLVCVHACLIKHLYTPLIKGPIECDEVECDQVVVVTRNCRTNKLHDMVYWLCLSAPNF